MTGNGSTTAVVVEIPTCDICKKRKARYDARSKFGPWGYMCEFCWYDNRATHELGTGNGQILVLQNETVDEMLTRQELEDNEKFVEPHSAPFSRNG